MKTQLDRQQQVNAWHTNFSCIEGFFSRVRGDFCWRCCQIPAASRDALTSRLDLALCHFCFILFFAYLGWDETLMMFDKHRNESNKTAWAVQASQTVTCQRSVRSPDTWRDKKLYLYAFLFNDIYLLPETHQLLFINFKSGINAQDFTAFMSMYLSMKKNV